MSNTKHHEFFKLKNVMNRKPFYKFLKLEFQRKFFEHEKMQIILHSWYIICIHKQKLKNSIESGLGKYMMLFYSRKSGLFFSRLHKI